MIQVVKIWKPVSKSKREECNCNMIYGLNRNRFVWLQNGPIYVCVCQYTCMRVYVYVCTYAHIFWKLLPLFNTREILHKNPDFRFTLKENIKDPSTLVLHSHMTVWSLSLSLTTILLFYPQVHSAPSQLPA